MSVCGSARERTAAWHDVCARVEMQMNVVSFAHHPPQTVIDTEVPTDSCPLEFVSFSDASIFHHFSSFKVSDLLDFVAMAVASIQLDVPLEGADDTTVCIFQRHIQLVLCHFPTTEKTLRPFGEYQRVRKQLLSQAIHSRRISAEGRRARLKTQSAYVIQADRRRNLEAVLTFKGKETDEAVFSENTESFGTAVHKSGAVARRLRCRNRISKVVGFVLAV